MLKPSHRPLVIENFTNIKQLFENHFGDPCNKSAFIQDLQRMRQLVVGSTLTSFARLQTHIAIMLTAVSK